jgi:hypothetical protein
MLAALRGVVNWFGMMPDADAPAADRKGKGGHWESRSVRAQTPDDRRLTTPLAFLFILRRSENGRIPFQN